MNAKTKGLLFEAYRRNDMADDYERSKPLERRWLGLGTAAVYRPVINEGYKCFHDGKTPPPLCMGWLILTPKGVKALQRLEAEFSDELNTLKKHTDYSASILGNYTLAGGLTAS